MMQEITRLERKQWGLGVVWKTIVKYKAIYLLLAPGIIWYLMFAVAPLSGLILAFKKYRANLGIFASPWIGLMNFDRVFHDPNFWNAIRQTFYINVFRLVITFPFPVILAIIFNEVRIKRSKKSLQVVFTLPHFLSWVVIASIFNNLLSYDGLVNNFIQSLGFDAVKIIGNKSAFVPLLYFTDIWRTIGWTAIIYMAAIANIDTEQFEAADIDGATRWQKITRITLPSIMSTVVIMLILATGRIMTAGFNQVFNFSTPAVRDVAETLDMYIYRITFQAAPDFGFSMAITLFRSVVNLLLLLMADYGSKMLGGNGLFGFSGE